MEFRNSGDLPRKTYDELIKERNELTEEYNNANVIKRIAIGSKLTKIDKEIAESLKKY